MTTLASFEQLEKLKRRSADTTFKVSTLHVNTVDKKLKCGKTKLVLKVQYFHSVKFS